MVPICGKKQPVSRSAFVAAWILGLCAANAGALVLPPNSSAQVFTDDDYARAESYLAPTVNTLVYRASVRPNWLDGDRFWYGANTRNGTEHVLVDPGSGVRTAAFDRGRVAEALSQTLGRTIRPEALPRLVRLEGTALTFADQDRALRCDLDQYTCTIAEAEGREGRGIVESPDGRLAAFILEHNLWIRELETGTETRLTTDGEERFGYATNNAGWVRSETPVVLWSPDSRRIATFQHDARGVGDMYMVSTNVGRPELEQWPYPLVGDSLIFRISRIVIDLDGPRVVRLDMPPDPHRSTTTDHVADWDGRFLDVQWSKDSAQLAFVSSSRDHKEATLRIADPETGIVRDVLTERVDTYYESGVDAENWRVLFDTNEVIWYSERSDWGHLYLYDLITGELKHQITDGAWAVQQLRRLDEEERMLYFTAGGREEGDPYFHYLYRVSMDGGPVEVLTPERAHHTVTFSPSGRYVVDSYSTYSTPPVTVVRDKEGNVVVELERADIADLIASGWQPPVPFMTKARDGVTDLFGLLYKPTNFDSSKSYPVLNYLYPGPQSGSVGSRSFRAARSDKQAVAELGFIIVEVDAMGTPGRSKSFHDAYYGNMGDNGLPDQITTIEQLAARHDWMDIDRVGIWGHSGGGFASAGAILRYPDFYKVAVSGAGNHDNRNYEDDWGEKWQGLLEFQADGTTNYDNQANHLLAENLTGKLLLAHGLMDGNVPASNTLLLVEALVEANKDFDLLVFPNGGHGFGNARTYWMRKRWDYFVRHLLGAEPPKEYEFGRPRVQVAQPTG